MLSFENLKSEYEGLWASMKIRPEYAEMVDAVARKLVHDRERYQAVEHSTGVPWPMIAALHSLESGADFDAQLAQGDPLDSESVNEPRGRGPFDTWEESAVDALVTLKHLDQVKEWTPARICYEVERYNGFGYRNNHSDVKSPYLWSYTTHYTSGKYVRDGRYSASAVSKQCGAIPIIKSLMAMEVPAREEKPAGGLFAAILWAILAILGIFRRAPTKPPQPPVPPHPASVERPWMRWAAKEVGFHEIGTNRNIGRYTGPAKCGKEGDPWCAVWVNAGFESVGIRGTRSAMACSFERDPNFVRLDGPAFGAVTTMWRGRPRKAGEYGQGHVFFYVGHLDNTRVLALGGNQDDQVCRQPEPANRIVGYWWPKSVPLPKVGKVIVEDDGNEEGSET